jgi:hypothetical protein
MSILKRTYLLDSEIKDHIQRFVCRNPIVTIQRAWRRYSYCNPLLTYSYDKCTVLEIIEDIKSKLYFVHTPNLYRTSTMGTPEWCCPWKQGLVDVNGFRMSYFEIAKRLAASRRRSYRLEGFDKGTPNWFPI